MKRATSSPSPGMQKKRQMTSVGLAAGLALAHARHDVLDRRQRQEVDERAVAELAAEPQHPVAQRGDARSGTGAEAASRA